MRSPVRNSRGGSRRGHRNPTQRAIQLFRLMVERPAQDWGVREVGTQLGMSPSSAHRLLNVFHREGWIDVEPGTGRYRASLEFYRNASRAAAQFPLQRAALPVMQSLAAACSEMVLLGVYDPTGMRMMFVAAVESPYPLRYVVALQEWIPIHVGASGLAITAFLPEAEQRVILKRTRVALPAERGAMAGDALEAELEKVRREGYACSHGQRTPGAVGIAAPVWGPTGRVAGSLVVTIPEQRFDPAAETRLARILVDHANLITTHVGGVVGGPAEDGGGEVERRATR